MNEYWLGTLKAELTAKQIHAAWGSGDHVGEDIKFVNRVFAFWFNAREGIRRCENNLRQLAMEQKLEEAGTTGCGPGDADNLAEVFEHICKNHGEYTDEDSKKYDGGIFHPVERKRVEGPLGVVNFAEEVDEMFESVKTAIVRFNQIGRRIESGGRHPDWEQIGKDLQQFESSAKNAQYLVWATPRTFRKFQGEFVKWTGALCKIHKALTDYAKLTTRNRGGLPAGAITALSSAVSYLPVLGDYFSLMVDLIPEVNDYGLRLRQLHYDRVEKQLKETVLQ